MKNHDSLIRAVCASGLMAAVTAVLSPIAFPLPFSPVPVTLSLLAVFSSGVLLTPGQAFAAQLSYLLLGAAGAPVFAGFSGGIGDLLGPTGGFLLSYPLMAWAISAILGKTGLSGPRGALKTVGALAAATVICYAVGALWLSFSLNMDPRAALAAAVWPFIPFDAVKIAAAAAVLPPVRRALRSRG